MIYHSLAVIVMAAALLSTTVETEARPGRGRRMAHRPNVAEALELTTEQQDELKALNTAGAKAMTQLGADLKIAQMELRSLMGQPDTKAADVKARVAEVNRVRSEVFSARIDQRLAKAAVFTPEQKGKIKGFRQGRGKAKGRAMRGRGRQMKGRGHAMMGGGRRAPGRGRAMAPRGKGAVRGRRMHRPDIAKALELTSAQQEKLKALKLSSSKAMIRLQADQKVAMLDLRFAMGKAAPGAVDVKALVGKVNNVRARILSARVDQQLASAAIFTPEQKEKMKQLKQESRARKGRQMMQRGRPMMRGGRKMMMRGPHMQRGECPLGAECPGCPRCLRESCPREAPAAPKQ